jgi:hypothetical protein
MKYAVEMGSGAMIHIPSLIKIGSGIQNLIRGIHRHVDTQHGDDINLFQLFQNRENKLKRRLKRSPCCPFVFVSPT